MAAAANKLACDIKPKCKPNEQFSTPTGDFILGKRSYINNALKGSTSFAAEIAGGWAKALDFHKGAKEPGIVSANTQPTWRFLYNQIKAGEDVEVLLDSPFFDGSLTLTGISFDPKTKKGTLSAINPGTGKPTRQPIALEKLANGF